MQAEVAPQQMVNIVKNMLEQRYGPVTVVDGAEGCGGAAEAGGGGGGEGEAGLQGSSVLQLEVDGLDVVVDVRKETVSSP